MKRRILFIALLVSIQAIFTRCSSEEGSVEVSPPTPAGTLTLTLEEVETLNDAGMDETPIEQMVEAVSRQECTNIHSILIVKNKDLVLERYFPGNDQNWGYNMGRVSHTRETLHDLRSITKSVVAACIGIALDKGIIKSVDQNIFDFFPEYEAFNIGLRKQITIEDLLTMTPGMQWDETSISYTNPANPEIEMTNSEDPIEYVLSKPMINNPGEVFVYNGGATQLLAGIIAKASGMQVDEFANEFLLNPLDIENYQWHSYSRSNVPAAASGLRLRSRGLMKFGLLYHNKGVWEGEQILSEEWIEESFHNHIDKPNRTNAFFGYHFHIPPSFISMEHTIQHVAALGNGDQRIFHNENDNLMVVFTAGNYNQWKTKNSLALMKDFIYPSFL